MAASLCTQALFRKPLPPYLSMSWQFAHLPHSATSKPVWWKARRGRGGMRRCLTRRWNACETPFSRRRPSRRLSALTSAIAKASSSPSSSLPSLYSSAYPSSEAAALGPPCDAWSTPATTASAVACDCDCDCGRDCGCGCGCGFGCGCAAGCKPGMAPWHACAARPSCMASMPPLRRCGAPKALSLALRTGASWLAVDAALEAAPQKIKADSNARMRCGDRISSHSHESCSLPRPSHDTRYKWPRALAP